MARMDECVTPLKYAVFTRGEPARESKVSLGPFRATQIWNEIVTHLKLTVEVKRRRHKMRYIDNCFTGTDSVNVVLQYLLQDRGCFGAEICREKAIKLCQTLMERSVFEPVSSRVSEGKRPVFEDSHSKMYQFIGVEPLTTDYETDEAMEDSDDDAASSSPGEERRNNQDLEPDIIGSGQDREMLCEPMLLGKQSSMMTEVLQLQKGLKRKSVNMAASHPVHNGKASRRFSFPEGTKFGDNPGEIHPAAYEEMWREVALRQLLTLVDVPILDGLLLDDKCHRRSNRFNLVIPNVIHQQLRPLSQAAAHSDPWVKSALAVLEGLPLGLSVLDKELRAPVPAATKRELFRAIRKHYTTCQEPLLPERFIDLYLAILNLVLQERDDTAVKALQLLMILLPWHVVEEVHRLVQFMSAVTDDTHCSLEAQEENKMVAINAFTDMLIQHPMISHSLATVLVGFILTYCQQVFTVPRDIEEKVHFYIEQVKQGKLDPVIGMCLPTIKKESYCDRLTEEEYCRQAEEATAKGLKDMIDHVLDDTKIPLKEKKIRLKQFQKCHPEICAKYFPDIV